MRYIADRSRNSCPRFDLESGAGAARIGAWVKFARVQLGVLELDVFEQDLAHVSGTIEETLEILKASRSFHPSDLKRLGAFESFSSVLRAPVG